LSACMRFVNHVGTRVCMFPINVRFRFDRVDVG